MQPTTAALRWLTSARNWGLLLLAMAMTLALGGGIASGDGDGSEAQAEAPVQGKELPGRRTETSNTYLLPDGTMRTELFEAPVNYRDEEGDWQPIEEGLEETPGGTIVNGENSFDLHLPESLAADPIRLSTDEAWVSEKPIGIATQDAQLEGEAASYESPGAGVSFQFTGLADGLKENIVLEGPDSPATLHFLLEASSGLTPTLTEAGAIEFRDAEDKLVSELPAPLMSDSASSPNVSDAVHYGLEPAGQSRWQLTVEADREWLENPAREFPVAIDPTITVPAPSLDCAIANGSFSETSFCGTSGWPTLGLKAAYKSSGADEYVRTLLRFALSSIPKTASISSATVGVYSPKEAKNTAGAQLYDANKNWNSGVDWKYWDAHHNAGGAWTAEGGDYGKYMSSPATVTTAYRGSQAGWWEFKGQSLAWLVQRWIDGKVPNEGVLLKLSDEKTRECCIERQIEWSSSATANKPYLSVEYIPPASADSKVTSPSEGTRSARRFKLTAAWTHQGVTGVKWQYKSPEGWVDVPPNKVIDKNGQALAKWPYAVEGGEQHSEPLYWDASEAGAPAVLKGQIRAVLVGAENAGGYTPPVEVQLNRDTGGPKDATAGVGPGNVDLLTGNFTVSSTDVAIPGFGSSLEFSRTHSSRDAKAEEKGVLGQGWKPTTPVEEAGGAAWRSVKEVKYTEEGEEGETYSFSYAIVTDLEGVELPFEVDEQTGSFITPPELTGFLLTRLSSTQIALTDSEGNRTVFDNGGSGAEYLPISVAQTGGPNNKTRMVYQLVEGKRRLTKMIAPTAKGVSCSDEGAITTVGCHVLTFTYQPASSWGAPSNLGERLAKITYYAATSHTTMGSWEVAKYEYDSQGRLFLEWDPRQGFLLRETYAYTSEGQLQSITPPGLEPWTMEYGTVPGETADGRLIAVKRASLVEGNPTAQTTIAYGVPLSGSGAPYEMGVSTVAKWGQQDFPTDATAVFPANEVPSSPPSSYARASVYYMDAEGQLVNTASPAGAGTEGASITTSETDEFGNVVRELSAQNRLRALAAGEGSVAKSHELETKSKFSADGTELQEEWGPMHQVRLESGESVNARLHRIVQYEDPTPPAGEPAYHLPTRETTGANIPGRGEDADQRVTEYAYNWTLRKPIETIVDPKGLNIRSVSVYDGTTGLLTETRQPSNSSGGGAGTTKIVYYSGEKNGECKEKPEYAGLPCKVTPAAQPGTEGQPKTLVKEITSYNQLGEPLATVESPGGNLFTLRTTTNTYDASGRPLTRNIEGGGNAIPKVETTYDPFTGLSISEKFVCNILKESCTGFDSQEVKTTYDTLGRPVSYEDADGNKSTTTYDLLGRPITTSDGKGSQTVRYDSVTGLAVELEDSGAGVFTASYDADGNMTKRGLPDGLTAETTYDPTGAPTHLTYTKASNCGESCTWLDFGLERSISGQILNETGTLASESYGYDKVGRLTSAQETPTGGGCTTRLYSYDQDSNRLTKTTRQPGVGGACATSGGTTQNYKYDSADRLSETGLAYDSWGRITKLPGSLAGGNELETGYFSNDMVASQSQGGITNTFQLDASLRQRQRLQGGGGLEGAEIFHYDGPTDAPAWTERGSTWTRNIADLGGELAAIQESGQGPVLQLTNLHGDVVATTALSPTETKLKSTSRYDEFGNQLAGSAVRFGWLGGEQRRTELPSGVIQMGARSYVPEIGRFLSTDPVPGGSANPYDYVNADPLNSFDLNGNQPACTFHQFSLDNTSSSTKGQFNLRARAWAHCKRGQRHVSVKAVIVGGYYEYAPGLIKGISGQTGPLTECGNVGVKFTCAADAHKSFEAHPGCGETWPGELEVVFQVHWESRGGVQRSSSVHHVFKFGLNTTCYPVPD